MECHKIDLSSTKRFSSLLIDFVNKDEKLADFHPDFPHPDNFKRKIDGRASFAHRDVLVKVLQEQYDDFDLHHKVKENIDSLSSSKTFTITTGHQLNIFTGPLYFLYKIVTVINACRDLKEKYPDHNFVPVYWMATEDHDFEEISHFRFNEKKYNWKTDQTGAVGRFNPSSISELFDKIPGLPDFFKSAYRKEALSDAVRYYVNSLFEEHGLVIIDADHKELKKCFTNVIKADLKAHDAQNIVTAQLEKLAKNGYDINILPREVNFFYLKNNLRERIERSAEGYEVVDSNIEISDQELDALIDKHPEYFSPNVILRPLYQETILPNLAYIGGPAEVAYWLPLKELFKHHHIPFPVVMPRNYAIVIPGHLQRKIDKIGLEINELFDERQAVIKAVIKKFTNKEIELNGQLSTFESLFEDIREKALDIDPTLGPHVEAQKVKLKSRLNNIEKKFIRAEKRNQSDKVRQTEAVLDFLFPNGNLQERTDNFLNFYLENPDFITDLIDCFDPFDLRFHILNYGK